MSAKTFLENLNLDDNDVKNLVEAVFMANLIGDEQEEGPQKELVLGWQQVKNLNCLILRVGLEILAMVESRFTHVVKN